MSLERDPGSFRDPSGFVFTLDERIYRAIDSDTASILEKLDADGTLLELFEAGRVVETTRIEKGGDAWGVLHEKVPKFDHFLEHGKIDVISYPYEWSTSMLADAAVRALDVQARLIQRGYSLKDSSGYNIQFAHSKPVFIDIPSIEIPTRRDIWVAMGQFCKMFVYPLLLKRTLRLDTKGYFLANIDGMELDDIYAVFGFWRSLTPGLLLDVGLPHLLQKLIVRQGESDKPDGTLKKKLYSSGGSEKAQLMNLSRLRRKVTALARQCRRRSRWTSYAQANTYSDRANEFKMAFTRQFLEEHQPARVLDLGCNTGQYSELAARHGAKVVAVDSDHDCVDLLYQHAAREGLNILPLWMDIASTSPGLGFRNRERPPFLERVPKSSVFALALLHHLLVSSRLDLPSIRDFLHDLTSDTLLIEYIDPADDMFQSLLALRENIYGHHTLEQFLNIFGERFKLLKQERVPETERTLLIFEKIASNP